MFNTKTSIIDASSHSNSRSEIRLDPDRLYTGNIRLGNLGCVTNQSYYYTQTSGIYSLIQNIYLYDGKQLLDQLPEAHHLLAFRTLAQEDPKNNRNGFNFNVGQYLSGTTNSYRLETDTVGIPPGYGVVAESNSNVPKRVQLMAREVNTTNSSATTSQGWLNLQQHFKFLSSMMYQVGGQSMPLVDTSVFRNLRVIIEWRSSAELHSCFQGATAGITANMLQPQLYCDEIIGEMNLPKSMSFIYNAYELDKVNCNGSVGATTINTKARSNAYNGKYLQRLLWMNVDPAKLTDANAGNNDGVKCDGSMAMNEVIQLLVNGQTLFDFNGIDTNARKLAFLTGAWGSMNIPVGSNLTSLTRSSDLLDKSVQNLVGKLSYGGALVNQRVTELQVEHSRVVTGASNAFTIYLIGEVPKQLVMNNGSYTVSYA
jgi:hypothetical protein